MTKLMEEDREEEGCRRSDAGNDTERCREVGSKEHSDQRHAPVGSDRDPEIPTQIE